MYLSRFDHAAARHAALEHAKSLHRERLSLSLSGLLSEAGERHEIDRRVAELELRELALVRFAEDPFAADSLQRIFDRDDRGVVLEAGRPGTRDGLASCAA